MGLLGIDRVCVIVLAILATFCDAAPFLNATESKSTGFCDSFVTYSHQCIPHESSLRAVQIVSSLIITSWFLLVILNVF